MQSNAIESLGHGRIFQFLKSEFTISQGEPSEGQDELAELLKQIKSEKEKVNDCDRLVKKWESYLRSISVGFLLLALVLSFYIYVPK